MIARRAILTVMLAAVAAPAWAQAPAGGGAVEQITTLDNGLLAVMKAGKSASFAQRTAMLTPVVQAVFDLPTLLQSSVGPAHWTAIPDPQKAELLQAFTQFTVSSYVGNFDAFNGEKFTVSPDLRHVGTDVVVSTRLSGASGDITKLDYQMRDTGGGTWKVVDILLDGSISRVAVTRSDFRSVLAQGEAPALIASLRAKSASLAAGATP